MAYEAILFEGHNLATLGGGIITLEFSGGLVEFNIVDGTSTGLNPREGFMLLQCLRDQIGVLFGKPRGNKEVDK
jgi:hypothetical protein